MIAKTSTYVSGFLSPRALPQNRSLALVLFKFFSFVCLFVVVLFFVFLGGYKTKEFQQNNYRLKNCFS